MVCELRALDAMNGSGLWMTSATLRRELITLNAYEQLRVVDYMSSSGS